MDGLADAIRRSPAIKASYINLMSQPGETSGFTAADHVAAIDAHAGGRLVDVAVVNTGEISEAMRERYAVERAHPVVNDEACLRELGVDVLGANLLCEDDKIRHNSPAAAAIAIDLAQQGRNRRQQQ